MGWKKLFVIALAVLLVACIGCVQEEQGTESPEGFAGEKNIESLETGFSEEDRLKDSDDCEIDLNVSTDKPVYGSEEKITILVNAFCASNVSAALIKVEGIEARGFYNLEKTALMDLNKGNNLIELTDVTPYCTTGCGGIYPGLYDVNVAIEVYGNLVAEAGVKIELTK